MPARKEGENYEKKVSSGNLFAFGCAAAVSYTHLDVYKRQVCDGAQPLH